VIVATAVQLRVGARLLLGETNLRISEGDRIGLVGRNGAGKTTLTKVLAGEALAAPAR
jgi:ATPase subunit of ABC transporter with duplicated ATPase domains